MGILARNGAAQGQAAKATQSVQRTPLCEQAAGIGAEKFSDWFRIMLAAVTHEVGNSLQVYRLLSMMRGGEGAGLIDRMTSEYSRIRLLGSYLGPCPEAKTVQDLRLQWTSREFPAGDTLESRARTVRELCPAHLAEFNAALDEAERIFGGMEEMSDDVRFHYARVQNYGKLLCGALDSLLRDDLDSVVSPAPQRIVGRGSIALTCVQVANERSCTLTIGEIDPSLYGASVSSNPLFIRLIVSNLLMNAHNARKGHCVVRFSATREGKTVRLAFRDNGSGMDGETMEKLNMGIRTTTSGAPGHGIGFAYCRELAGRLGGRLFVECSGPGRGTTVVLELAACQQGQPPQSAVRS